MALDLDCPWNIESLEDFLYYCCPECNERNQSRNSFLQHALHQHPSSNNYLVRFVVKAEFDDSKIYIENELNFNHTVNKFINEVEDDLNIGVDFHDNTFDDADETNIKLLAIDLTSIP